MSRKIHLVGIGGSGLSAIARVLHQRGDQVTGSDLEPSVYASALIDEGISVHFGHDPENIQGVDQVLRSSAVALENVEVQAAIAASIPVFTREDFLPSLLSDLEVIAVAGSHGKTTTAALIAWILHKAGLEPGYILGGVMKDFQSNAAAGDGTHFVIEADEYGHAFLGIEPNIAVITNIEFDHPDQFASEEELEAVFAVFSQQVKDSVIVCMEDPAANRLPVSSAQRRTYGLSEDVFWRADQIRTHQAGGSSFVLVEGDEVLGLVQTRLPGDHNVLNILGAIGAARLLGVAFESIRSAVEFFSGVEQRFEIMGQVGDTVVVDDYAHHPTEIAATLQGARQRYPEHTIWAVFQPHTYSRAKQFVNEWGDSLALADYVVLLPIFASREVPDLEFGQPQLAEAIDNKNLMIASDHQNAIELLIENLEGPSLVVLLSAGDGNRVGKGLLEEWIGS